MTSILKTPEISRRSMLAGLGGMTFCLALGTDGVSLVSEAQANTLANAQVTPWVRIAPDGTITILTAGAEMGQGSMTDLPTDRRRGDWMPTGRRSRSNGARPTPRSTATCEQSTRS